jgi:hypothetical protein
MLYNGRLWSGERRELRGLQKMDKELLRIYDKNHNPIGTAARSDVHKSGYWLETFHCWFAGR